MSSEPLTLTSIDSPIGPLAFACDASGAVRGVSFADGIERSMRREYPGASFRAGAAPTAVEQALADYFAGDRAALDRIVWSLDGAVSDGGFQSRVWRALVQVPVGTTISTARWPCGRASPARPRRREWR